MKAHTDLEQSKTLSKILPIESADMCWTNHCYGSIRSSMTISAISTYEYKKLLERFADSTSIDVFYHAWSLAALLNVLPKIDGLRPIMDLEEVSLYYTKADLYVTATNPLDACYEMILLLHDKNLI